MQATFYPALAERVRSQHALQAGLYGHVDFSKPPYRFTTEPWVKSALPEWVARREPILDDARLVELIRTTTLLGDVVADPYAALVERYSVRQLIGMLIQACRGGIDSVPDAPAELRAFMAAMEATPDWVDMSLVEEGARQLRIRAAFASPFLMRGSFLGTFLNTYAALPMAITGALTGQRAAHRVNETSSFFAATTLPGAMTRHGPGFEAAAMVRLMHSMVRYNALKRSGKWDAGVYGIPVPQIDQMPAGLIPIYLLAMNARRKGRSHFTAGERAQLEFSRYRSFLLGLPEELLPTTADEVIQVFHARAALLRDDFDDATCGELVRSTIAAYLRPRHTLFDRAADAVERSWSKIFFAAFFGGNLREAARRGVRLGLADVARIGITAPFLVGRFFAVMWASKKPKLQKICDDYTIRVLNKRLETYGKPEYTTDAKDYPSPQPRGH